jgi:hypothetical protein
MKRTENIPGIILGLVFLGLFVCGIYGWVNNIVVLFSGADVSLASITLLTILRIVGIFVPPLGAVLGWV